MLHPTLLTLPQAAALFPVTPCASTVWRWATKGVRGTILNTVRTGARLYTTVEAVEAFMRELSDKAS